MNRLWNRILPLVVSCVSILWASTALAQTTTTTEKRNFEIISVDGNKVVFRGEQGVREVTLPADFVLTVDGREVGVAELKPGMKGTAVITTKTTQKPVVVTEVRNAEVMAVTGNTIIVKNAEGYRKFTQTDVNARNITIMREGQNVQLSQLRPGDKLTATIITQGAPTVVTERDLKVAASSPAAPAPAPAMAPAPAPAMAPAPAAAPAPAPEPAPAATLPKTGSNLPLVAGFGLLALATGLFLTLRRTLRAR
ncbi:MAG TPA: LPXTG cell wall anchor domain-containing protein [Thermoanaerobaculia bacterium]|jgi:LPXTG-motif cell wall-anchored protein